MPHHILHRLRQIFLAVALLVPAAFLPLVAAYPAEAAFAVCHGDPILLLNKGLKVSFTVELNVPAAQVVSVVYTVHAPKDATLKSVKYTKDDLTGKESVVFLRDSPDTNFHVTTVAHARPGAAASVWVTGINKRIVVSAIGVTDQPVAVTLSALKQ